MTDWESRPWKNMGGEFAIILDEQTGAAGFFAPDGYVPGSRDGRCYAGGYEDMDDPCRCANPVAPGEVFCDTCLIATAGGPECACDGCIQPYPDCTCGHGEGWHAHKSGLGECDAADCLCASYWPAGA